LTTHNAIREAAAVSVPNKEYGEVVGAWIVREPGTSLSREKIRELVALSMNPQVSEPSSSLALTIQHIFVHRMLQHGFGSLERMATLMSFRKQRVGRSRSTFYGSGVRSWLRKGLARLHDR
jgi:acyl-CoA synthetase (AMP-forming)/AMP-acid ligase II